MLPFSVEPAGTNRLKSNDTPCPKQIKITNARKIFCKFAKNILTQLYIKSKKMEKGREILVFYNIVFCLLAIHYI